MDFASELESCRAEAATLGMDWALVSKFCSHPVYWRGSEERVRAASSVMERLTELRALAETLGVDWASVEPGYRKRLTPPRV